jgi:hypothetical protein
MNSANGAVTQTIMVAHGRSNRITSPTAWSAVIEDSGRGIDANAITSQPDDNGWKTHENHDIKS